MGKDRPSGGARSAGDLTNPKPVAAIVPLVKTWRVDREFHYLVPERFADVVAVGSVVAIRFGNRKARGIVVGFADTVERADLIEIERVVVKAPVAHHPIPELVRSLSRRYVVPQAAFLERFVPPRVRVAAEPSPTIPTGVPRLLPSYRGGSDLVASLGQGRGGLWGVRCEPAADRAALIAEIAGAVAPGRSVLVAVPEVAYGSEVLERLCSDVAGFERVDSTRSPMERARALVSMAGGNRAAGGGRAAVLCPAPRLGAIVLDEEHHASYKEERTPRYDARVVAIERARLQGAACVLVSPSPSIELGEALLMGRARSVEPSRSAEKAGRPVVEVVEKPGGEPLSEALRRRMRDVLRSGGRAAILAPRRGYALTLWCSACRRSIRCTRCEAAVAYDRDLRRTRCPSCGLLQAVPDACAWCGSVELRYLGAGSARLAEQLAAAFPRARVVRMDPEVLSERSERVGDADIYVTTWIGTKQTLRPNVELVGVLDADVLIRRPDFRAAERAYHALVEMAGWAGPASAGGRLIVQSAEPGHHSIQGVVRADYRFFLERELAHRRELMYPPFSELVRIEIEGDGANEGADTIAAHIGDAALSVLGPVPSARSGAIELLVKCVDARDVGDRLRVILASAPGRYRVHVDTDPR